MLSSLKIEISKLIGGKNTLLIPSFTKGLSASPELHNKFSDKSEYDLYLHGSEFNFSNISALVEKFTSKHIYSGAWTTLYAQDFTKNVIEKKYDEISQVDEQAAKLFKHLFLNDGISNVVVFGLEIEDMLKDCVDRIKTCDNYSLQYPFPTNDKVIQRSVRDVEVTIGEDFAKVNNDRMSLLTESLVSKTESAILIKIAQNIVNYNIHHHVLKAEGVTDKSLQLSFNIFLLDYEKNVTEKERLSMFLLTDKPTTVTLESALSELDKDVLECMKELRVDLLEKSIVEQIDDTTDEMPKVLITAITNSEAVDIFRKPTVDSNFNLSFGMSIKASDIRKLISNINMIEEMSISPAERDSLINLCYYQMFSENILGKIANTFSFRRSKKEDGYISSVYQNLDDKIDDTNKN